MMRLTGHRRGVPKALLLAFGTVLLIAAVVSTGALAATAHAAKRLRLPVPQGATRMQVNDTETAPDGSTYVLTSPVGCKSCGGPRIYRFDRQGHRDPSFGDKGYVLSRFGVEELALDGHGRLLVVEGLNSVRLRRFTKAGRLDRSFGDHGVVSMPKETETYEAGIVPLPGGGILVKTENIEGVGGFKAVHLEELREDGRPRRAFAGDGQKTFAVAGAFHAKPAVSAGGAIYIAEEGATSLTRISQHGRLDIRFDRRVRGVIHRVRHLKLPPGDSVEIGEVVPRAEGGVDVFGRAGRYGFDIRVGPDGRAVPGFGRRGLKLFPDQASSAVPLVGGGFFVLDLPLLENPSTRVFVLREDATIDHRFHGDRPVLLPEPVYWGEATRIGPRRVAVSYIRNPKCEGEEKGECKTAYLADFTVPAGPGR